MENELNGIIIGGKVYEAIPELNPKACDNCDLKNGDLGCPYVDACIDWNCIFKFSQSLTDRINRK